MLPFVQIKGDFQYKSNEMLETSDIYDNHTGKYYKWYELNGKTYSTAVTLTLTMTDYKLLQEHYELVDFEILDGCYFTAMLGIFDTYINKYKEIKMNSTGAIRELAKLYLNNLYGKMASSKNSSFKIGYVKEDDSIGFTQVPEFEKQAGYIPCGSAITSYARNFTIRTAQQNYYGVNKRGFIYADTDSIHCDLAPSELKGLKVDDVNFCCWKLESCWDKAWFVRQKTYIEHITEENLKPIEEPYYNIKCAGMPDRCKQLFKRTMQEDELTPEEITEAKYNDEEIEYINNNLGRTMEDFTIGLKVPSKLMPKRISGGTLLVSTTYEMR